MTYLYAKYDSNLISNAANFYYSGTKNGIDSFMFTLLNFYDEHTPTWRGRYDEKVILYRSDTDSVVMVGTITRVIGGNPLNVTISGTLIKMSWYGLHENFTKSKIDSFVIAEDPDTYGLEYHGSGTWTNSGANGDIIFNGRLADYQLDDNADYVKRIGLAEDIDTCEFWFAVEHMDCDFSFLFQSAGDTNEFRIYTDGQMIKVQTGDGITNYENIAISEWYHVRVSYDKDDVIQGHEIVTVTIIDEDNNSTQVVANEHFIDGANRITEIEFHSSDDVYDLYIDGPAIVSDGGYSLGDNKTPTYEYLYIEDEEGDSPALTPNTYNTSDTLKYYGIVSDNTLTEQGPESKTPTINSTIVVGDVTAPTDWEDTTDRDEVYWKAYWVDDDHGPTPYKHYLDFSIESENIDDTSYITKIEIELYGEIKFSGISPHLPMDIDIYWSPNNTLDTGIGGDKLLSTISGLGKTVWDKHPYSWFEDNPMVILPSKYENDQEKFFTKNNNEWNGGYIFFYLRPTAKYTGGVTYSLTNWIDHCKINVYYATEDFETINLEVYDTGANWLKLYNSDQSGVQALSGKGIAKGDSVNIGISVEKAFARCFNSIGLPPLTLDLRNGTSFNAGIAEEYGPQLSAYKPFTQLCEKYNLHYWIGLDGDGNPIIKVYKESDIGAAAVTYSAAVDMPTTYEVDSTNNEYGYVRVIWNGGITPRIQAGTPSTNEKCKWYNRKDILLYDTAIEYATQRAEELANLRFDISCSWNYLVTNMPSIGTKYNFTLPRWDGSTFTTVAYTEQVCRSVSISQDGTSGGGWLIEAGFGHHLTSGDEAIGRAVAENKTEVDKINSLLYTSQNSPVTRHAQLSGVTSSQHHAKYTDAQVDAIVLTHKNDDDAHHAVFENLVEDTTPQLGGDLDCQDKHLTGVNSITGTDDITLKTTGDNACAFWANGGNRMSLTDNKLALSVPIDMNAQLINEVLDPVANQDAATKKYVDDNVAIPNYVLQGALPYLEANKQWLQCIYEVGNNTSRLFYGATSKIQNVGATDGSQIWQLPNPCKTGAYKLIVDAMRLTIIIADATDYVTEVRVSYATDTGSANHFTDLTNRTASGNYTYDFAADGDTPGDLNLATKDVCRVLLKCVLASAGQLGVTSVELRGWYEAI